MRAAGPAPAATRPALANDASSRRQPHTDRVLWFAAAAVLGSLLILLGVVELEIAEPVVLDAYIHFRYAENIAQGEGFVYRFQQHYALIGRWPWYAGPVSWHDLPASVWGGVEMRAYHRLDAP